MKTFRCDFCGDDVFAERTRKMIVRDTLKPDSPKICSACVALMVEIINGDPELKEVVAQPVEAWSKAHLVTLGDGSFGVGGGKLEDGSVIICFEPQAHQQSIGDSVPPLDKPCGVYVKIKSLEALEVLARGIGRCREDLSNP